MADVPPLDDDDTPLTSSAPPSNRGSGPSQTSAEDEDQDDGQVDYTQLTKLLAKSNNSLLPKRGEKDFERHGTRHQDDVLERSREAMHDALAYTRVHTGKSSSQGYWVGSEGADDEVIGLGGDYCVVIEEARGSYFKTTGKVKGLSGKEAKSNRTLLWLLPEEALYLVERGNLDLWWPRAGEVDRIRQRWTGDFLENTDVDNDDQFESTPMSLQAAYSVLIGRDGERGTVELDRYTVYANLKRCGYVVLRAPEWNALLPGGRALYELLRSETSAQESQSIFNWLWGRFFSTKEQQIIHPAHGPLVKPGFYRSYNSIYKQIAVIPRHKPAPIPNDPAPPPEAPYRVVFHLWKPSRIPTFAKSNPGLPDFRIAVVNARTTSIPSLTQISSLLESTPYDPPPRSTTAGVGNMYARIRKGHRSVVIAVVDEGLTSYTRFGEAAFGEELLFEGFDGNKQTRGKTSGRGRGGGRGRGRGRGRGK